MSKKEVTLKLHGKPFDPLTLTDRTGNIRKFLDNAPNDTLFDSPEMISALSLPEATLGGCRPALVRDGYALKLGRSHVYGNQAAIAELKLRITN